MLFKDIKTAIRITHLSQLELIVSGAKIYLGESEQDRDRWFQKLDDGRFMESNDSSGGDLDQEFIDSNGPMYIYLNPIGYCKECSRKY